ncbi:NADP-dependent oxidoreductase domain-containing protein [Aspergillus stella-maris]|uniref:NADP-dependent oxidoreductase domain-containing protein n=1 Tax=Aspergillus stella-maris TaxID=1810926 RepID=UPI003CCDE5CC
MSLPTRPLGLNGHAIPAMGLGFGSLSGFYGAPGTIDERLALLDHAHCSGLRFWDMADVYGDSENLVREWCRRSGKRDEIIIATKFGLQRQQDGKHTFRSDPEYVKEACGQSLERLGVDCIDLYYCHRVDGKTPIESTIGAMVELKKQGKIRHLGLSETSPSTLRRAHAVHPISAIQMEYSLFTLDIESESESGILSTARELGVTVVAYSPIGRGILTGAFRSADDIPTGDLRGMYPKYSRENFPGIMRVVKGLESVAARHSRRDAGGEGMNVTAAQVALAWVLAQGGDIVPIPGTKSVTRMSENVVAARIKLTGEEVQWLRGLAEGAGIGGARYPAAVMATLCLDTPPL